MARFSFSSNGKKPRPNNGPSTGRFVSTSYGQDAALAFQNSSGNEQGQRRAIERLQIEICMAESGRRNDCNAAMAIKESYLNKSNWSITKDEGPQFRGYSAKEFEETLTTMAALGLEGVDRVSAWVEQAAQSLQEASGGDTTTHAPTSGSLESRGEAQTAKSNGQTADSDAQTEDSESGEGLLFIKQLFLDNRD